MKKFVALLILAISFTFTQNSNANTIDHEKPDITITHNFDVCSVQIEADYTIQGENDNHQRLHVFHIAGDRYHTSATASGYGKDIAFNKTTFGDTYQNKEQTSYSEPSENWRRNPSGMRMYRAEASGKNLQGNHYNPKGNYYRPTGNQCGITKPDELYAKTILLYRISRSTYFSGLGNQAFYQTKTTNLKLRIYA